MTDQERIDMLTLIFTRKGAQFEGKRKFASKNRENTFIPPEVKCEKIAVEVFNSIKKFFNETSQYNIISSTDNYFEVCMYNSFSGDVFSSLLKQIKDDRARIIHDRAYIYRGQIALKCGLIEYKLKELIKNYCTHDTKFPKQENIKVARVDEFSLFNLNRIFSIIVDKNKFNDIPPNPFDDEKLTFLNVKMYRNKLVHSYTDTEDEALFRPDKEGVGFSQWTPENPNQPVDDYTHNEYLRVAGAYYGYLKELERNCIPLKSKSNKNI